MICNSRGSNPFHKAIIISLSPGFCKLRVDILARQFLIVGAEGCLAAFLASTC